MLTFFLIILIIIIKLYHFESHFMYLPHFYSHFVSLCLVFVSFFKFYYLFLQKTEEENDVVYAPVITRRWSNLFQSNQLCDHIIGTSCNNLFILGMVRITCCTCSGQKKKKKPFFFFYIHNTQKKKVLFSAG